MKTETVVDLLRWIENQTEKVRYGDISLKLTLHEGKRVKIEKSVVLREFEKMSEEEGAIET